jgi:hypothetical protein
MKIKTLAAAALMVVSAAAQAASIQSSSATFAGTVIDFNGFDGHLLPQIDLTIPSLPSLVTSLNLGSGVTLSTSFYSVVGANDANLDQNGQWTNFGIGIRDGNFVSSAFIGNTGSMIFSFASAQQNVSIFANQFQQANVPNRLTFTALDGFGNTLESSTVSIDTAADGYDEGMFIGFQRSSADIRSFVLTDGSFVVDNLTISAVPEPESYAMLLAGLAAIGAAVRRRKQSQG